MDLVGLCVSNLERKTTDIRRIKENAFMPKLKATVKLKTKHAAELEKDSKRVGRPVDDLLAQILEDFLRGWRSDKRWIFYQQSK